MSTNKLNCYIRYSSEKVLVGQLVLSNREILFRYSQQYLKEGYNLSPIKLSFDRKIQPGPRTPFNGLFGVFSDSLPDAWGKLLMKKYFEQQGTSVTSANILDQLTYVGENGFGALEYEPDYSVKDPENVEVNLDLIDSNVQDIIKGKSSDIIDQLFESGGSPGGALPQIHVNFDPTSDSIEYGKSRIAKALEPWIIKFAANVDAHDISNIELAYYYMALDAGIAMNKCQLFEGQSGKKYFGTKRFDRNGTEKFHMISVAGLLHDNFEHSQLDYGILMHEGMRLTGSAETAEQVLALAAFNIFAHNRDDHSKNFAFLMNQVGEWRLAPAYDLTFSSSAYGNHSTSCAGNSINPGSKELHSLIDHFSIKKGRKIVDRVKHSISKWDFFAEKAEVSAESGKVIGKSLELKLKD